MNSYQKVAIFGGGNAAYAVSAILALQGIEVTLVDFPEFKDAVEPVIENGGISLLGHDGPWAGKAKIAHVTTDLASAVSGVDALIVCAQAYAHGRLAREVAPFLEDGQHVILLPGTSFGAWEFRRNLDKAGVGAEVVVGETNTLVCATRKTLTPGEVAIKLWATEVFAAALPSHGGHELVANLTQLFPQVVPAIDTLETCLLNLNPYVHSAPAVLSISAVERSEGDFRHYVDGITPSTARAMADLDAERVQLCKALGYRDWSVGDIFYRAGYMAQWTGDWVADMQSRPVLREARGPFGIDYRYYTEDTGVGLTVIHSIGKRLGIDMPTHFSLVHLTSVMGDTDYFGDCTRTMDALEIPGANPQELRAQF